METGFDLSKLTTGVAVSGNSNNSDSVSIIKQQFIRIQIGRI